MLKILNGYNWLDDENTKEVEECTEKGLLKYTDDESRPQFIALESNIIAIKEILKDDYDKLEEKSFIEWLEFDFCGNYDELKIESIFGDKIYVRTETILALISDEEETYFDNDMKLKVYNAECPDDKVLEYLNQIGRDQARIQIQALLQSVTTQTFR